MCSNYECPIDGGTTEVGRDRHTPSVCDVDIQAQGFVELAACLGFPEACTRMAQASWPQVLLCMGSRVDEERYGSLPCDCVDADGNPPTETRSAWLVATRDDPGRGRPQPCWVYSQILQQSPPADFVPERFEDSRVWWSERHRKDRKAVVVFPKMGSVLAFKHHRRSPGDGRWFRLRRYRGVASIPLASVIRGRSNFLRTSSVMQ